MTDLGTFGTVQSAHANGINETGLVAGYAVTRAFLWQDGVMTDLNTVPGTKGIGWSINNLGQVAGSSTIAPNSTGHPVLWDNGVMTDLAPGIPANEGGSATAINNVGQIVGTLVDDEPRVSIDSVTKNEGNSGTTQFVFTVSLSPAPSAAVSLSFATANGSAKSGEDYDARSGSLAFTAGQTSKTIAVGVKGDRKAEWQEVFYVNLSGATGAFIVNNQGTGVVRYDDR